MHSLYFRPEWYVQIKRDYFIYLRVDCTRCFWKVILGATTDKAHPTECSSSRCIRSLPDHDQHTKLCIISITLEITIEYDLSFVLSSVFDHDVKNASRPHFNSGIQPSWAVTSGHHFS